MTAESDFHREIEDIAAYFDAVFYLDRNPDVAADGMDPVAHYVRYGWRERRDPSPDFCTLAYLQANPDVEAAEINPFWHYVIFGRYENRSLRPAEETPLHERQTDIIAPHVDAAFYLGKYPDVAEAGIDPVQHYCVSGWREGRDPSPAFSTGFYLSSNPDVAEAGINPLWHYVVAGQAEGRAPRHPAGRRHELLAQQTSFKTLVAKWLKQEKPPTRQKAATLGKRILARRKAGQDRLVIAAGQDDYRKIGGGVQFCIQREEKLAPAQGALYVNIHPWQPLPCLADRKGDPLMRVIAAGEEVGTVLLSELTACIESLAGKFTATSLIVHHLMGHQPEALAALAQAAGASCHVWLHDSFTICPSFALQRNNVAFCGAPDIASNACQLCLFGEARQDHQRRLAAFFRDTGATLIAPSEPALAFWRARGGIEARSAIVIPHLTLAEEKVTATTKPGDPDRPLRLAFIGTQLPYKGWTVFCDLHEALAGQTDLEFWCFGTASPGLTGITHVPVNVTAEEPDAMVTALREQDIDFVLHWADCFETFSFSTCEAIAAGASVITNRTSGNVTAIIEETGHGIVLSDKAELMAFLTDGRAQKMAQNRRKAAGMTRIERRYSALSFAALDGSPP